MEPIENKENVLRKLPGVDRILELSKENGRYNDVPKSVLVNSIRFVIEELRARIIKNEAPISIETQNILDGGPCLQKRQLQALMRLPPPIPTLSSTYQKAKEDSGTAPSRNSCAKSAARKRVWL